MEGFRLLGYKTIRLLGLGLWAIGILYGCGNKHRYIPRDIEPVAVNIVRFDSALLAVHTDNVQQDIAQLYVDYEEFMPIYVEGILELPTEDTAYLSELYADFLTDTTMGCAQTHAKTKEVFADIASIQQSLNNAFSRLHYLYPDWEIPEVYFFVSGFHSSVMYYENIIGVGIDMYLGSDYPYYNQIVYDYQKTTMQKECVPVDIMRLYTSYHIPYNSQYNRVLEQMIYRGKQLFLLQQLLTEEPAWEIIGYTKEQWQWCEEYERAIWNRIMEKRDLFKTDSKVLSSYINDGPFTAEVTQDSPGRLGQWVGWRIVESYMRNNQNVSIQELLSNGDAQMILEKSFYKP